MKLFAAGAVWAIYALLILAAATGFAIKNPNISFAIESSSTYPASPAYEAKRRAYLQAIRAECVGLTKQSGIYDHIGGGATYRTECNSVPRAFGLSIVAAMLIIIPVAIIGVVLRKRKK
jgi:hypothetical protein